MISGPVQVQQLPEHDARRAVVGRSPERPSRIRDGALARVLVRPQSAAAQFRIAARRGKPKEQEDQSIAATGEVDVDCK
jgi:hypothetical protein